MKKEEKEPNRIYLKVQPVVESINNADPENINNIKTEKTDLESRVIKALSEIYDPEIPVNIYDLGLIYNVDADAATGLVKIIMTLTSPGCPVAQTFPQTIQESILKVQGVSSVTVDIVFEPPWTKELMSEVAKLQLDMF